MLPPGVPTDKRACVATRVRSIEALARKVKACGVDIAAARRRGVLLGYEVHAACTARAFDGDAKFAPNVPSSLTTHADMLLLTTEHVAYTAVEATALTTSAQKVWTLSMDNHTHAELDVVVRTRDSTRTPARAHGAWKEADGESRLAFVGKSAATAHSVFVLCSSHTRVDADAVKVIATPFCGREPPHAPLKSVHCIMVCPCSAGHSGVEERNGYTVWHVIT